MSFPIKRNIQGSCASGNLHKNRLGGQELRTGNLADNMEKIKVLISKEQIENRVKELAKQIRKDYKEKTITAICLLKGSLFFTADLTREIGGKIYLEFMQLSSYEGENTTGTIKLKKDIDFSEIKGVTYDNLNWR